MLILIGLTMFAVGIVAIRGAYILAHSGVASRSLTAFLSGQLFAVFITGMIATGPILVANALLQGTWKMVTTTDTLGFAGILGLAVVAWIGLGRVALPEKDRPTATLMSMPTTSTSPTLPKSPTIGGGAKSKRRAA